MLQLDQTKTDDAGMRSLGRITTLEKLNINFTQVTNRGLRETRHLKQLKRIDFVGTAVNDDGVEPLKQLSSIEFIGFSEHITPEAIEELERALPLFRANTRG